MFDADFGVAYEASTSIPEVADDDGDPCDDLAAICAWVDAQTDALTARFAVRRINFSTYGATLVHLGVDGRPLTPLYDYLKPVDIPGLGEVYGAHGGPQAFHANTGSPPLGMLNSGLQLLWLRSSRPRAFAKTYVSLHLPNYLAYRLTGVARTEFTSIGCHTCLWDFPRGRYHDWLAGAGVLEKLPRTVSDARARDPHASVAGVSVGVGVHDSSAALVPYLRAEQEPFVLLSTGTWSIALNPTNTEPLTTYELSRDCLTFMRADGSPVKAARLFLGYEHDARVIELAAHYGVDPELYKVAAYEERLDPAGAAPRFAWEHLAAFAPRGTGHHFGDRDFLAAYHRLVRELVDVQLAQLDLVVPRRKLRRLLVDGGMSKSGLLLAMLGRAYPGADVVPAGTPVASALGAAILVNENLPA